MNGTLTRVLSLFKEEKKLTAAGVTGLVLAAGLALYMLWFDTVILPEGDVGRAFSFDAAVGLFVLTIAILLPFAGMNTGSRKKVRGLLFYSTLLSYGIETIQHLRGINPRFTEAGSVFDSIIGAFFGVITLVIITATIWITAAFFRKKETYSHQPFVTSIRYAFLSVLAANAAGLWMIVIQGSHTGETGNIIVLHGLGYHALQTLPLTGFLLLHSHRSPVRLHRLVHIGGISWMAALFLIFIQTVTGRSVFTFEALPFAAFLSFMIWGSVAAWAAWKYFQLKLPLFRDKHRVS
ncbi:hypothetical protein [Salibacterium aidingense]|uniref:hypothetical protein n=1 Tax=Salibacterium aidingense TaxID=384933 RepID=UPI0004066ECF|nr:hypothetical protein [Salibacterium aidingense]